MKLPIIKMILIGGALVIGFSSYLITKKPDGVVEQTAEAFLRTQGIDIDLSPQEDYE